MKRKNLSLLVVILVLIVVNTGLYFFDANSSSSLSSSQLDLPDTTSISSVKFSKSGQSFEISRTGDNWKLEETYAIDASFKSILMAVFTRVKLQKVITGELKEETLSRLEKDGAFIEINDSSHAFWVLGNPTRIRTYFVSKDKKEVYEVGIPGYTDFVGGIFLLSESQWRDRTLFSGSIRTIQQLTIDYSSGEDLTISYNGDFFNIETVSEMDTTFLENYLSQFRNYQANERLTFGGFPRYDSLAKTTPMAVLSVQDLTSAAPWGLSIFPALPGENFHLAISGEDELVVFNRRRIQRLLRRPGDFSL